MMERNMRRPFRSTVLATLLAASWSQPAPAQSIVPDLEKEIRAQSATRNVRSQFRNSLLVGLGTASGPCGRHRRDGPVRSADDFVPASLWSAHPEA
ncbi:MAG: hypothetical protein ACXW3S_10475 [Rhodoplanes sp.]